MAKRILRESARPTGWSNAAAICAATCVIGTSPAIAAIDLSAGVTIGAEHDSNPIELSDEQARIFEANGFIPRQDDTSRRLTANAAAAMGVKNGPIYVSVQTQYTRVGYAKMDTLNHTEYNTGGHLDWRPGQSFDVSLDFAQIRTPVSLNDVGGTRTVQQTSRQASGAFRLRPTPNWQVSLSPGWYENQLPLQGANAFQLRESSGTAQLDYLGAGRLVPGVLFKESRGKYSGVANATRYEQRSVGGSLIYKVSDFSSFNLFAGYTRRTTHLLEPTNDPLAQTLESTKPSFTGRLSYQRQLSVKTSINIAAFRDFQQYDVGVNTSVARGLEGGVTWKPTPKLSTSLDGGLVRMSINGLQIARTTDEREDLERRVSLNVKYQATRRFSLRTYLIRRLHNSNVRSAVFDRTTAGLELSATVD